MTDTLEAMAETLEKSGRFRVLRRLAPMTRKDQAQAGATRHGLFLDLETTGLDPRSEEVIEIAMLPFAYTDDERIVEVGQPFERLRQPTKPVPATITTLTGITDAMVAGHTIDPADIEAVVAPCRVR